MIECNSESKNKSDSEEEQIPTNQEAEASFSDINHSDKQTVDSVTSLQLRPAYPKSGNYSDRVSYLVIYLYMYVI